MSGTDLRRPQIHSRSRSIAVAAAAQRPFQAEEATMSSTVATHQPIRPPLTRYVAIAAATVAVLVGVNVNPAQAEPRPDPGLSVPAGLKCGPFTDPRTIPVEHIGNHLVRCDYLVR
jgi:hypothetical protein